VGQRQEKRPGPEERASGGRKGQNRPAESQRRCIIVNLKTRVKRGPVKSMRANADVLGKKETKGKKSRKTDRGGHSSRVPSLRKAPKRGGR